MYEQEVLVTFMDMINQEEWNTDVFTGDAEIQESRIMMTNFITLPTPHPHVFINIQFDYEFNQELGDELRGEI